MLLCDHTEAVFDSIGTKVQTMQVSGKGFRVIVHKSGRLVWLRPTRRPRRFEELGMLNEQVVVDSEALLIRLLADEHVDRLGEVVVVPVKMAVSLPRNGCVK